MFRSSSLLLLGWVVSAVAIAGEAMAATACHSIAITAEIRSGEQFEKAIGGDLIFRIEPEGLGADGRVNGSASSRRANRITTISIRLNPPLRNGLQTLGPSYGDDTGASLAHPHEMRFLLNRADYDRIWPLLTNALWPYSAPHPEKAADEYVTALKALAVGEVRLTVLSYDAEPVSGSIRRIKFRAEFTAPAIFEFEPALQPRPAACLKFD